MLQGFLIVLMFALAYGLLFVIYGKEGLKLREEQGKKNIGVMIGLISMLLFWILCVFFLIGGMAKGDSMLCVITVVIVPVLIVVWTIIARKNVKKDLEQRAKGKNDEV